MMPKIMKVLISIACCIMLLFNVSFNVGKIGMKPVHAAMISTNFPVTEDVFTLSTDPSGNYGSKEILDIKNYAPYRYAYMKADFNGLDASVIDSATLKFFCENPITDAQITVEALNDDSWHEDTVTYNTADPNNPSAVPSEAAGKTTVISGYKTVIGWNSIDVKSIIQSQLTDKVITFKISGSNTVATYGVRSSEYADVKYRPYVNIVADPMLLNGIYPVTEDTYAEYSGTDKNNPAVGIKENTAVQLNLRETFMKVNFNGFQSTKVDLAKLNFYVNTTNGKTSTYIYALNDDSWDETKLIGGDPNTIPTKTGKIVCPNGNGILAKTGWNSIDVTSLVNTQMTDKVITFYIMENSGSLYSIKTSENTDVTLRPYLELSSSKLNPVFTYKDAGNNTVVNFTDAASGSIQVTASLDVSAVLILALYDSGGTMVKSATDSKTIVKGTPTTYSASINGLPSNLSGYYAKAFVWDNENDIKAYGGPFQAPATAP